MSSTYTIGFSAYVTEATIEQFLRDELGAQRSRAVFIWPGVVNAVYLDMRESLAAPWYGVDAFPAKVVLDCEMDLASEPGYWKSIARIALLGWKRLGGSVVVKAYDEIQLTIIDGVLTIPRVQDLSLWDPAGRREYIERLWQEVRSGGGRDVR